jgi:hypothetical protein
MVQTADLWEGDKGAGRGLCFLGLFVVLSRHGEMTGAPRPMSPRDRSRFLSTLDETIQKLKRKGG